MGYLHPFWSPNHPSVLMMGDVVGDFRKNADSGKELQRTGKNRVGSLVQGCPAGTSRWPNRNWAVGEQSFICIAAAPYCSHYCTRCEISGSVRFHRSWNATVNSTCAGPGLCTSYENLMPDDLILHYGDLLDYFIIYHNITTEIKCITNAMCLNHPPSPAPWKNCP